jgi:hypothetical protein
MNILNDIIVRIESKTKAQLKGRKISEFRLKK